MDTYTIAVTSKKLDNSTGSMVPFEVIEHKVTPSGTISTVHRADRYQYYDLIRGMYVAYFAEHIEIRYQGGGRPVPGLTFSVARNDELSLSANLFGKGYEFWVDGTCRGKMTVEVLEAYLRSQRHLPAPSSGCECGSDKLGHPGHSDYCPKFEGARRNYSKL